MFEVTETAEEDDQYDELAKKSKYLVFSMRQVQDKQAALSSTTASRRRPPPTASRCSRPRTR
jgi:hypothetical protein